MPLATPIAGMPGGVQNMAAWLRDENVRTQRHLAEAAERRNALHSRHEVIYDDCRLDAHVIFKTPSFHTATSLHVMATSLHM